MLRNHWTITDCCNALLITCCTALYRMQRDGLGLMHYPLVHHQYRAVWPIAFRSKRLYHICVLPVPCSDTSWELTSMESKGNVNKHHKNIEIDSFETWHIKKTTQIGLWSHCRCYVGQYIYALAILTVFVLHPASWNFPPSIPLIFFKLSIQHQPAITRIENWAILPTQGLQLS